MVSTSIVGELKDIELCVLALDKGGDRIPDLIRKSLFVLHAVRRWVFLIALGYTVPLLVLFQGGDALSVRVA